MSIIELKEITKAYNNKKVLDKFSLKIEEGEIIAVMGASGCGKSTLLNIIGLLESPDEGELIIDGNKSIAPNSKKSNLLLRETIGYLFQNFALVDEETVEYNLKLATKYLKISNQDKNLKIKEALEQVGLSGYENQKIYQLSGGEQQRVAIARVLIKPCKIILADEPTGSVDEKNRDIILDLLKDLNKKDKTILIVTHDKHVADQCQKIITL